MKKVTILKVMLILVVGIMLLAKPLNIFAATEGPTDLNDLWTDLEDQGGKEDLKQEEQEKTPNPTPESKPDTTPNPEQPKEELPKAGLAEDTVMVISIMVLGAIAVYTFKKVNDYQNI